MAVMSTYLANHLLDHSLGKTSFTSPDGGGLLDHNYATAASTGATIVGLPIPGIHVQL